MRKFIFFALLACFAASCHGLKKSGNGKCNTLGTVRNFAGLDGCGLLVELENGDKLNPVSVKDDFELRDGQKIQFSYKIRQGVMSICMAEKASVDITCIKEIAAGKTEAADCADTNNPFAVPWIDRAFDRHNPVQIFKYRYEGNVFYLFEGIPESFLYDCKGNLICLTHGETTDDCHRRYLNLFGKGKMIYQGEGVWD